MESVLVVDDEADILKLISENLMIRGYKVAEAQNAETALQRLHEELPSLMVLDIKLPDSTGWELLEQVKGDAKIKADFPVLIMTAMAVIGAGEWSIDKILARKRSDVWGYAAPGGERPGPDDE
jgi:CheY-like chemotaxis protein